jgi:FkbM family methyltransferase
VDVGAFHPYHYSNTYVLHKRGWSGINIDPNRDSIAYFNKYRPNDINLVCGVSDTDTEHPYFVYNHQSCNTFSEEKKLHNEHKKHLTLLRTDLVRCRPLRDILNKHLDKGEQVDVLNVDVEGLDLMVLKTNDWERYRPRLVVVESEVRTGEELWQSATYTFLRERGYHLVGWMGASLLFKGL